MEEEAYDIDRDEEVIRQMLEKDYAVFAPKDERDLRRQYPELWDYSPIAKLKNSSEVLFAWWYGCRSSPIIALVDEKRFVIAVDRSFKPGRAAEVKTQCAPHGQAPELPNEWKAAVKTMQEFNPGMRIQMAVDNLFLFRECQRHIRQERSGIQKDREDYLKTAERAREIQEKILKSIEKGNSGVEEKENTTLKNLEDVSSYFHKHQATK